MIEFGIITAFLVSLSTLILLRPMAVKFDLVDYPNKRKNHNGKIPLIGGVSVFLGMIVSYLFFIDFDKFSNVLLITASLILIHGVYDDYIDLKARNKIVFQALISLIMIYVTDVKIETFGDLFGFSFPFHLGIFSIPITIIAIIGLTNAINMLDGLDGLAAGIVLIAISGLIFFNQTLEFSSITYILVVIAAALLPFIIFNMAPYSKIKVFLGDGGSLFLGYIISWALIYNAENINSFNPSFALWCVAVPLFDFLATIILRIVKKQSIIRANRDHIHHILENLGFSKILSTLLIISFGLVNLVIGIFLEKKFPSLSFTFFLILFLFYLFIKMHVFTIKKVDG